MARNPLKDKVAIAGVGSTAYGRDLQRTPLSLGIEAALKALADAGIDRKEVDGILGTGMTPLAVGNAGFLSLQGALGIEKVTWGKNGWLGSALVFAVEAVFSGPCDVCLVVQAYRRELNMSRSAARDPFRLRASRFSETGGMGGRDFARRWLHSGEPYAAWIKRYMHDFGVNKDAFGLMAVNNRSHGARNPDAVVQKPITLDDYYASRMIWEPMQMLDMDIPIDGAEAFVVTTTERARDLKHKPVTVHAMALGGTRVGEFYENALPWDKNAFWVAMDGLWARSDLRQADVDLFYPYDGYTIDAVAIVEAAGFCGPGESADYFRDHWDRRENILRLNGGRTLVTTGGGGLAHGRTGGSNLYSEAVRQLRGTEGERQAEAADSALVTIGSMYHDPSAVMLRSAGRA
jgi:acetyl-CoA acetyltransferase